MSYGDSVSRRGKGGEHDVLLRDWYGTPIDVYVKGEETPESVVVSGGFRGDCEVSRRAVVEAVDKIEVSKKAYFIPTMDPTGSRGVEYVFKDLAIRCGINDVDCLKEVRGIDVDVLDDVVAVRAGNLYLLYPLRGSHGGVEEFLEHVGAKGLPLEKMEGFLLLVSPYSSGRPARSMHVDAGEIMALDEWKSEPPGHVGLFLSWIGEMEGVRLYVEAGCGGGGEVTITLYRGASTGVLEDIASLAAVQVENSRVEVVQLPLGNNIYREIYGRGVPIIKITGGSVESLTTVLLSILNSFAFFSV